jgi:hypothetical protein
MDANRIDDVSRLLALRASRRRTLRRAGAGGLAAGLLSAVGFRRATAAQDETTCIFRFSSEIAFGRDEGDVYDGTLSIVVGPDGAIDEGEFETDDGDVFAVVGHVTGRGVHLRVQVGDGQVLAMIGTAEREVPLCRGRIDGTFGGPRPGDLGSWSAVARQTSDSDDDDDASDQSGSSEAPRQATSTPRPNEGGGDEGADCQSGIVCGEQCCAPREGYSPDAISCDGGFCACTYSCASAGCQSGDAGTYFTVGCDDRPDAVCDEYCNFPDDDDAGDGGGGSEEVPDCVDCGTGCCSPYPGTTATSFYCQGTACVCYYRCSDVCTNGDPNAYFTASCDQDPGALCANVGCLA